MLALQAEFRVNRGFYPTPDPIIQQMLQLADIQPGNTILEPSAGSGNIANAVREAYPDNPLACVEYSLSLCKLLKAQGFLVYHQDFTRHRTSYDRILANPPFEKYQDMRHLWYMYQRLNPGGRIVSVLCDYAWDAFYWVPERADNVKARFMSWFIQHQGIRISLPLGSFLQSERPTPVPTCLVVMEKPHANSN